MTAKTPTIEVSEEGYLINREPGFLIPSAFWHRLYRPLKKAMLYEEFLKDFDDRKAEMDKEFVGARVPHTMRRLREFEAEANLFKRWLLRLGLNPRLLPWSRGWTEAEVDNYLTD